MTCANCEALEARIAEMERRLGIARLQGSIGAVVEHFNVSATQARLLLQLYAAGGGKVGKGAMMDVMSTDSPASLRTTMWHLRQAIGDELIETSRASRQPGCYSLTPVGMSKVLAALERPEFQETRGCTE